MNTKPEHSPAAEVGELGAGINLGFDTDEPTVRQLVERYYRGHQIERWKEFSETYLAALSTPSLSGGGSGSSVGLRISFSPSGPHGCAVVSPDEPAEGVYWTLIGSGPDHIQNDLARQIVERLNAPEQTDGSGGELLEALVTEVNRLRDVLLGIASSDHYRRYPKQHEDGGIRGQSGLRAVRALTGQHGSYVNDDDVRRMDIEVRQALTTGAPK